MPLHRFWVPLAAVVAVTSLVRPAVASEPPERFEATAYSIGGHTAAGTQPHEGVVAADPRVLPLGSRIRVHDAGDYSGVYVVRDTGPKIKGRAIDLYLRDPAEAKRFGRRTVRVEVLAYGNGSRGAFASPDAKPR